MARTANPESKYNVFIHVNGKYRYASTQPAIIDKKTGKKKYVRIHWGTIDDNNVFHPNSKYLTSEERHLLKFPKEIDISMAKALTAPKNISSIGHKSPSSPCDDDSLQYQNKLYGDIWLMERIADRLHVREDLMHVFADNAEKVKRILTIVYYIISQTESMNHIVRWQNIAKVPTAFKMTPTAVTELVQSINEGHRLKLLKSISKRIDMSSGNFCAVDTSTVTSDSECLSEVKTGFSKEGGRLPQTIIVVVYSLSTHTPIYYDVIQGNMPDSRGLDQICKTVTSAGFLGVIFITDRGYFTFENIKKFLKQKTPAIMAAKTSVLFIKNIITEIKFEDGCVPVGMDIDVGRGIYYKQYKVAPKDISTDLASEKKYVYLNLYFNSDARVAFIKSQRTIIEFQRQELERLKNEKETIDKLTYKSEFRYFNITFYKNSYRIRSYTLNEKKVNEDKLLVGFFANLEVNLKLNPIEANEHYRLRDEQEKSFEGRKTRFSFDRLRCSTEESLRGREFILFVASIILSYLRQIWRDKIKSDKILRKKYPTEIDILEEMRSIRYIDYEGQKSYITPFVGSQLEICRLYNFDVPKGCEPSNRKN